MNHLIVFPYWCKTELDRYAQFARHWNTLTKTTLKYEFLFVSRWDIDLNIPSEITELSKYGRVSLHKLTEPDYDKFNTKTMPRKGILAKYMFVQIFEHINKNYENDGGFVFWAESDIMFARPDWLTRLDKIWRRKKCVLMGHKVTSDTMGVELEFPEHFNGVACYAKNLIQIVSVDDFFSVDDSFDVVNLQFLNDQGKKTHIIEEWEHRLDHSCVPINMDTPLKDDTIIMHGCKKDTHFHRFLHETLSRSGNQLSTERKPMTKFAWINQLEDELKHEWGLYGRWEYDQKNFVIPNVFDEDEAKDEFNMESARRKGYLGEIENRLKEAYASMIRENNNVRYVKPLDVDYGKLSDRYDKIKLIVQYYEEGNSSRRSELNFAFEKNLENPLIDEVHVLVESESMDLSGWDSAKIVKKNIGKRLTYDDCFQYARDNFDESDVALVCNVDCYFNESVGKLKKVNFNNALICMTRKDLSEDGKLIRPINPEVEKAGHRFGEIHEITTNRCLDYDSSDAWAFSTKLSRFSSNIELGTYSCEYFLHTSAINDGIKVRNVAEYVDCIHVHGTNYRNRYAVENELSQLPNRMYEGRVSENAIDGVWRVRSPENYIDENSSQHEYTDYVVRDFKELCE
jgi:hypothetical protein